jgi:hydroxymethylbilane synthase
MTLLRVGTRGSDLALWQANWVCNRLCEVHRKVKAEPVVIKTHGDVLADESFGASWPVGAFVSALENALTERRIELAVHSLKDLQTAPTPGLVIAAIPERGPVHDVLLTKAAGELGDLPPGARIGTSSPRRAAQLKLTGDFEIVAVRGNVPTRISKLEQEELDGIVLAAAGLQRLGIEHPHAIELPVDRFLPAPGQGALAIQGSVGSAASELASALEHPRTRSTITAERSFLREIDAGCHTPVGALATANTNSVELHGRLFSDDHVRLAEGVEVGTDPQDVGRRLAKRLKAELSA